MQKLYKVEVKHSRNKSTSYEKTEINELQSIQK